jgi:Tfp pilus assembly protein PilF
MLTEFKQRRADELTASGVQWHFGADLPTAIRLYSLSIVLCPTPEAHTLRGWAYSQLGHLDLAEAECLKAIELDPGYGNAYNDLGSYLAQSGRLDEAVAYLERAKRAPRCHPRHYPLMNLGRIFAQQGLVLRAIREFSQALELCPGEPVCLEALAQLRKSVH